MKPEYVVEKSIAKAFTPLCVLFFWLVIPTFVIIFRIIALKSETVEFYQDYVIVKKGVLDKREDRKPFLRVNGVSFHQSLMGRLFNYGDLIVDATGRWDLNLTGIKDPRAVKAYLETHAIGMDDLRSVIHE